jgi:hypothetical protein
LWHQTSIFRFDDTQTTADLPDGPTLTRETALLFIALRARRTPSNAGFANKGFGLALVRLGLDPRVECGLPRATTEGAVI